MKPKEFHLSIPQDENKIQGKMLMVLQDMNVLIRALSQDRLNEFEFIHF